MLVCLSSKLAALEGGSYHVCRGTLHELVSVMRAYGPCNSVQCESMDWESDRVRIRIRSTELNWYPM